MKNTYPPQCQTQSKLQKNTQANLHTGKEAELQVRRRAMMNQKEFGQQHYYY